MYEGITGANDTRYLVQEIRDEIAQINDILQCCAPSVCAAGEESGDAGDEDGDDEDDDEDDSESGSKTCGLFDVPSHWNGAFYEPWLDTMSTANYFSEFWLLQSLNNMTLPGNLSFEQVLQLSRVHKVQALRRLRLSGGWTRLAHARSSSLLSCGQMHMDLITNEVNSASFGATLLAHLTASFEQSVMGTPIPTAEGEGPRILQPPDNQFLYYAAHDINLLYVRHLLR